MKILGAVLVFVLALFLGNAAPVFAASIVVNTTAQSPGASGDCTLGEAIEAANGDIAVDGCAAGSGVDTIELPSGTYTLSEPAPCAPYIDTCTNGLPAIRTSMTILGAGADSTIIEREVNALPFRILYTGGESVLLRGITLRGGTHTNTGPYVGGAGIGNEGGLILEEMRVAENFGVGIASIADITIRNSEIKDNDGSGIAIQTAHAHPLKTVGVLDSEVTGNALAGITSILADLIVSNSNVSDNGGSGISQSYGSLDVNGSTIGNNGGVGVYTTARSGRLDMRAKISINKSAIFGNGGRGLKIRGPGDGKITISNSTLARNAGGILIKMGPVSMRIINSTIAKNTARKGGAILDVKKRSTIILGNTILDVDNTETKPTCVGKISSRGHNIFETLKGCEVALAKSDRVTNPLLGDWSDDGTPGNGHYPLMPDSPAIGAGKRTGCPETDQLGNSRVERCDIGAVEYIPAP